MIVSLILCLSTLSRTDVLFRPLHPSTSLACQIKSASPCMIAAFAEMFAPVDQIQDIHIRESYLQL